MRHDKFQGNPGILIRYPTKGTHWVVFLKEIYFESWGSDPLNIQFNCSKAKFFYSEYRIQQNDRLGASDPLNNLYLCKIILFKKRS